MKSKVGPGFYWVRFEGEVQCAERVAMQSHCTVTPPNRHWHIAGSFACYEDHEVCELLSERLNPPVQGAGPRAAAGKINLDLTEGDNRPAIHGGMEDQER